MPKSKRSEVYVDASIRPRVAGSCCSGYGIGIHFSNRPESDIGYMVNTTRRAISRLEMIAVRTALLLTLDVKKIIIYTDSQHCMSSLSTNLTEYISRGWLNINRIVHIAESDIARECIEILRLREMTGRETEIMKVTAHSGVYGNVTADQLAGKAATGTFNGTINDDVTHSNGVAITTDITRGTLMKRADEVKANILHILREFDLSFPRTPEAITNVAPQDCRNMDNWAPPSPSKPKKKKGGGVLAQLEASIASNLNVDNNVPVTANEQCVGDNDDVEVVAGGIGVELPSANVVEATLEPEPEVLDLSTSVMQLFLACISCLDTVLIKHRNRSLSDGIDVALGLTHCKTCVREILGSKGIDMSLGVAVHDSRINPALLQNSNVCRAIITIAEAKPVILKSGLYVRHVSCRQLFSNLTRNDEIHGVNVTDAYIAAVHGGFF